MQFEEKKKEKTNRKDYWLTEGIVVKIVTKKLGEKFYKKKAVVKVITCCIPFDTHYNSVHVNLIHSHDLKY